MNYEKYTPQNLRGISLNMYEISVYLGTDMELPI